MPNGIAIDYTARTLDVIAQRGLEILRLRVGETQFRDAVATGIVPAIIEVVAWYHEQNAHYYDRRRINSLLITADTRESMSVLAAAQGYQMRPATAASVAFQATPNPPRTSSITLEKGTRVAVGDLIFEVAEDYVIPPSSSVFPDGTTDDVFVLVEGTTQNESFTSSGEAFQPINLGLPNVIDGSVIVTVLSETWERVSSLVFIEGDQSGRDTFFGDGTDNQEFDLSLLNAIIDPEDEDGPVIIVVPSGGSPEDGVTWQQVEILTGAPNEYRMVQDVDGLTTIKFGTAVSGAAPQAGDSIQVFYLITGAQKRYELNFDDENRATIRFGDGVFGVIPPTGAEIAVEYRTGGGVRGNVPAGTIVETLNGRLPSGAQTPVDIRNIEPGSGGEEPETVDRARFFAPRFAKSNERAVTKSDFTTLAATYVDPVFGAPAHANAFLQREVPELNTVCVAVWSRDQNGRLAVPGTPLKTGIKKFLDTKRTVTTTVEMKDGAIIFVDITLSIMLEAGAVRQTVFAAVRAAIDEFFSSTFVLPGIDLSISNLYNVIQDVDGVESAIIAEIKGSVLVSLELGEGDGATTEFSGNFVLEDATAVLPGSVSIADGTQQIVDDSNGSFEGADVDIGGTNTVDYASGIFTTTFATAPEVGAMITAEAKAEVFFPQTEVIGSSDGNVQEIDGATKFYPIVKRAPRGIWSGDMVKVIDSTQVGSSAQMRGSLPAGVEPTSLSITDGVQTVTDDGLGNLFQGLSLVGTISYVTGQFSFTFTGGPPALPVTATWTTRTVDITIPGDLLPLQPGRLFFWGGFSKDGAQGGVAELFAFDDGAGNIVGDVLAGGTVSYEDGRVRFVWNTAPPPGPAGGVAAVATLTPAPDGVTRTFALSGMGDLSSGGLGGEGRTRFQFSDLSTPGVTFEDAYDNFQGGIDGESIDREGTNQVIYIAGTGTVTFDVPPAAGAPAVVPVQVTNVGVFMYSAWVFRVKTPLVPGLDKSLFADNTGRLWGDTANPFPTSRLDHLRGRFVAILSGAPIAAGRDLELTYDAFVSVPPALDVPIADDQVAALGRIEINEV